MTTDQFRLDRYLARIGHNGLVAPDLATLNAIHAAHVATIPFEGLDPLLGRPVKLDLASLQHKLIENRRGGYCYEQNAVLRAALQAIGFEVTGLGARVRWNAPAGSPLGPKTHMLLMVDLAGGRYLADAGFGACLLDAPLRFEMGVEQDTAMGAYRLSQVDALFALEAKRPDGWRTMYVFDLVPQLASDYELGSWYTSTSPFVPFTTALVMERVGGERRTKLVNRRLIIEARDGRQLSEHVIGSADELADVLDRTFGVTPPVPAGDIFAMIGARGPER